MASNHGRHTTPESGCGDSGRRGEEADLDGDASSRSASVDDPDADAIRRVLAGDPDAYAEVVARNEGALRRLVLGFVADVHAAEDILQEVFWIAYQRLPGFEFRARFRTWAGRIAVRRALGVRGRVQRWLGRFRSLPGEPVGPHPIDAGDLDEGLARLRRLPDVERIALVLHVEGYAYHEIAEIAGCPIGTVSARIHRARERLAAMGDPEVAGPGLPVDESLRRET